MTTGKTCVIRQLFTEIAGNPPEYRRNWFHRISDATGVKVRVLEDAWYHGIFSTRTEWKLRRVAEKKNNEARDTAARFQQVADRLEKMDPDFHREAIAAYRALAGGVLDRTGRGE